jgi:hypothetical protein
MTIQDENLLEPVVNKGLQEILQKPLQDLRSNGEGPGERHVVAGYPIPLGRQKHSSQLLCHAFGDASSNVGVRTKRAVRAMLLHSAERQDSKIGSMG